MLCQNCGENEVNFRYTQIINGVKKDMALCDKCAKILELDNIDFNMPIDFSSFLGDFLGLESNTEFLPNFIKKENLKCDNCGMTYDEFVETGKFGCDNCYNIFSDGINKVLKNVHGSDRHIGRISTSITDEKGKITKKGIKQTQEKQDNTLNIKKEKIKKLNEELKLAIKEERYEDAAKIRDEIKKMSN